MFPFITRPPKLVVYIYSRVHTTRFQPVAIDREQRPPRDMERAGVNRSRPVDKPSPSLLKWLILKTSACQSKINDMKLGQYHSRSGRSVDMPKSSNRTRTVRDRSTFISCERKPDSSVPFARVRFAIRTDVDMAKLPHITLSAKNH